MAVFACSPRPAAAATPPGAAKLTPIAIDHAHGALVTDVDGNTMLDFSGGLGCHIVGYSHPRVVEAVRRQAARFSHTDFSVIPYEAYIELAERLNAKAPGDFAVGAHLAVGNPHHLPPNLFMERGALGPQGQIELCQLAVEIGMQLFHCILKQGRRLLIPSPAPIQRDDLVVVLTDAEVADG